MNRPNITTPRILWLSLLMSQGFYLVMLRMPGVVPPTSAPPEPVMLYTLAAVALSLAVASFVLPAFLLRSAAKATLSTVELAGTARSEGYRAPNATPRGFQDRDAALLAGLRVGLTPFIIGLALNEAIAIHGLVLGYLGHPLFAYLPFFVVAWILMLARFPTENTFLRPIAEANGVTL